MTRNAKLFREIADKIEKEPECYKQYEWCGTACCIAGHAMGENRYLAVTNTKDARIKLGISQAEAERLFGAGWIPDGLEWRAWDSDETIKDGRVLKHEEYVSAVAAELRAFADGKPIVPSD